MATRGPSPEYSSSSDEASQQPDSTSVENHGHTDQHFHSEHIARFRTGDTVWLKSGKAEDLQLVITAIGQNEARKGFEYQLLQDGNPYNSGEWVKQAELDTLFDQTGTSAGSRLSMQDTPFSQTPVEILASADIQDPHSTSTPGNSLPSFILDIESEKPHSAEHFSALDLVSRGTDDVTLEDSELESSVNLSKNVSDSPPPPLRPPTGHITGSSFGHEGSIYRNSSDSNHVPSWERARLSMREGGFEANSRTEPITTTQENIPQRQVASDICTNNFRNERHDSSSVNSDVSEDSVDTAAVKPSYEGFIAHIRRLHPNMNSQHDGLVSRIARQQVIRYNNLLNLQVQHREAVLNCSCLSGEYCVSANSNTVTPSTKYRQGELDHVQSAVHITSNVVNENPDSKRGMVFQGALPFGILLPRSRSLPAEVECQFCFKVNRLQRASDWTKHVHDDLQPFTCSWENCDDTKAFKRKTDWIRHENEKHRQLEWWTCSFEDCKHISYREDNFLQHLLRKHEFCESDKPKIPSGSGHLTDPTWATVEACHHETTASTKDEPCKFCGIVLSTSKKLSTHLANHMERIAIYALQLLQMANIDTKPIGDPTVRTRYEGSVFGSALKASIGLTPGIEIPRAPTTISDVRLPKHARSYPGEAGPLSYGRHLESASGDHSFNPRQLEASTIPVSQPGNPSFPPESYQPFDPSRDPAPDSSVSSSTSLLEQEFNTVAGLEQNPARSSLDDSATQQDLKSTFSDFIPKPTSSRSTLVKGAAFDFENSNLLSDQYRDSPSTSFGYPEFSSTKGSRAPLTGNAKWDAKKYRKVRSCDPEKCPDNAFYVAQKSDFTLDTSELSNHSPDKMSSSVTDTDVIESVFTKDSQSEMANSNGSDFSDAKTNDAAIISETNNENREVMDANAGISSITVQEDSDFDEEEPRLANPRAYFENLKSLESEIYQNSYFWWGCKLEKSFGEWGHLIKETSSATLLPLVESYTIILKAFENIKRLQQNGYCEEQIEFLCQDNSRLYVARIVSIEISAIAELVSTYKETLDHIASILRRGETLSLAELIDQEILDSTRLTAKCRTVVLDRTRWTVTSNTPISTIDLWKSVAELLDLVVVSYAGAHITELKISVKISGRSEFRIPRPYVYSDRGIRSLALAPCLTMFRAVRTHLRCLDSFLGGLSVLVFAESDYLTGTNRLCLSTTIADLANLWGPCWKIMRDSQPGEIQHFEIGNGLILPWSLRDSSVQLSSSELFAHWVSSRSYNAEIVENGQRDLARKYFLDSDVILIGADVKTQSFVVNPQCAPSIQKLRQIKDKLRQHKALRELGTDRPRRYHDSHAVQITASIMGMVSIADTLTYKRRAGQSMKDVLVERWRNGLRNISDLETYGGVEVSLCTRNARRRKIRQILASQTMRKYLRGSSFQWLSDDVETRFYESLKSKEAQRALWKSDPSVRKNVGDAISRCLETLETTGVDNDTKELNALWVETFDDVDDADEDSDEEFGPGCQVEPNGQLNGTNGTNGILQSSPAEADAPVEEWIVTLFRSEHTWSGFLQDSEEIMTMAIFDTTCLDFSGTDYGRGCPSLHHRCNQKCTEPCSFHMCPRPSSGFPVLKTSLWINEAILDSKCLTRSEADAKGRFEWNARQSGTGTKLSLGDQGSLKVLAKATESCPLIVEWNGVTSKLGKEVKNVGINKTMFGKGAVMDHGEYMKGSWSGKPLPVIILSKSTKVLFS
ncbi:C2H2 and C2HC zinc finger [Glarea lozoyensis ATCC 20868]|uniref:C2H2 and C2HC zinc finger n=1 Tax=Glarea lozoyensis (strain ATCC 20868 / MF5171) TaxID=1116229 RepID=S3DUE1_GLAL2|nr:C2H2 and C2HC zinc finger [Glarea lozoyensis ATCC 20868]EPE35581.1 C2H2 and C2HC zinc finger [Glarea lozoyensis ATCC 20868]